MEENVKKGGSVVWFIVGLVVGFLACWAWNYFYPSTSGKPANGAAAANVVTQVTGNAVGNAVSALSKLLVLPTGETPLVYSIGDAATLANYQAFYSGAQNGDLIIIYQKAAKAIVYSPSRNMIENVGPIIPAQQNQVSSQPSTSTKK